MRILTDASLRVNTIDDVKLKSLLNFLILLIGVCEGHFGKLCLLLYGTKYCTVLYTDPTYDTAFKRIETFIIIVSCSKIELKELAVGEVKRYNNMVPINVFTNHEKAQIKERIK